MRLEVIDPSVVDAATLAEWDALHCAQLPPSNPFCSPEWVTTWYAHFATTAAQRLLVLIRTDSGSLVGVAPYYVDHVGVPRLTVQRRLRPVGSGQGSSLLEMPQVLTAEGQSRAVLAALVHGFHSHPDLSAAGDWFDLMIGHRQGWIEPQWFNRTATKAAFWRHSDTQACVMLPLESSWPATLASLKRNVKESLRRSRNRLNKHPGAHQLIERTQDLDEHSVNRFLSLHRARSSQRSTGAAVHPDAFADPTRRRFLRELLPKLGLAGRAAIWELWLDDKQVAAQLVLHAPGTVYVHSSGVDADVWELGPVTHLQEKAFTKACERGDTWVNFSPGPNLAKLRWSEQLLRHDEFALGFGGRGALGRHAAIAAGQLLRSMRHQASLARGDE